MYVCNHILSNVFLYSGALLCEIIHDNLSKILRTQSNITGIQLYLKILRKKECISHLTGGNWTNRNLVVIEETRKTDVSLI